MVEQDGDGNCLFRSVSHQVYGDDVHHDVVRRKCMDYMDAEQAFFEPYVEGCLPFLLDGLADEAEQVREMALRAGRWRPRWQRFWITRERGLEGSVESSATSK